VHWCTAGASIPVIDGAIVAHPRGPAPFATMVVTADPAACTAALTKQGWRVAADSCAQALKLLMGWPTLGREIDEKTLPQEVRFDELAGVKYDKGCYTGQETVARLHFRGHANRALRGVRWRSSDGPTDPGILLGEKPVGTLRTIARLGDETIALAIVRREVSVGETVRTGETEGILFDPPWTAVA
jgi:folate-binding protein YgfZ